MPQISPVQLAVKSKPEQEVSVDPVKRSGAPCITKDKSINCNQLIVMHLIKMTMYELSSSDLSGHTISCDSQLRIAAVLTGMDTHLINLSALTIV